MGNPVYGSPVVYGDAIFISTCSNVFSLGKSGQKP